MSTQDREKQKILVTGGAGFIGSHTVKELQKAGYEVLVFDNLSTGKTRNVSCSMIVGDLNDPALLEKVFSENKIDAILHFAGSIIVEESMRFPGRYFENNVVNGLNLLNAAVKHGVKKFVFSSSAAVYGNPEIVPVPETHSCDPTNVYGETKLVFEKILKWFSLAHGLDVVVLRYFNAAGASLDATLGPDYPVVTHLILRAFDVASRRQNVLQIFGNDYPTSDGTAIRDYIHVVDLAYAHVLALKKLENAHGIFTYNVGTGHGYTVAQVVEEVLETTGKMVMIEQSPRRPGDPAILIADAGKISKELGFLPEYSDLKTIVATGWQWYKKLNNL